MILGKILAKKELRFARDMFKAHFSLNEIREQLDDAVDNLETLETDHLQA